MQWRVDIVGSNLNMFVKAFVDLKITILVADVRKKFKGKLWCIIPK